MWGTIKSKGRKRLFYSSLVSQFFHTHPIPLSAHFFILCSQTCPKHLHFWGNVVFDPSFHVLPLSPRYLFSASPCVMYSSFLCIMDFWSKQLLETKSLRSSMISHRQIQYDFSQVLPPEPLNILVLSIACSLFKPLFPCILISSILLKTTSKNVQMLSEKERW